MPSPLTQTPASALPTRNADLMAAGQPRPRPERLGWTRVIWAGAGSLVASFYIGTGDISIATVMGAKFGFSMWWTYFLFGIAGWAMMDMSVRYFLRFGRTPMTIFKEAHPLLGIYMLITVVGCAILGASSQWNACAMVLSGFFPQLPIEAAGGAAASAALLLVLVGTYVRIEKLFLFLLVSLIAVFFVSAFFLHPPWSEVVSGLRPNAPGPGWETLFSANAGSIINAWLILIYPYTMMEKGWYSHEIEQKINLQYLARIDISWGMLAAAIAALPIMACATAAARPYGYVPLNYMDFALMLEPVAGPKSAQLFLSGLFIAAWTSGVGWWVAGAYALMDLFNQPIKLNRPTTRITLVLLAIPSVALLFVRLNPVYQILFFASFLAVVFPVMAVVLFWRISRKDMGLFRWNLAHPRGWILFLVDLFAVIVSLYVGGFTVYEHFH